MYLNPRNPHHGIDCICDSCCQYWHTFGKRMAEALARQRATEQAIDASGEGGDSTSVQAADSGKKEILPPLIETGECPCERDSPSDPSAGNPVAPTCRESVEGKTTRYRVELWDFMGKDPYYVVSDYQGNLVCQCAEKHNAKLIAWLLEYHS